jgi:prepilin-type N-terminal cleavage/methylation domain-containing protein
MILRKSFFGGALAASNSSIHSVSGVDRGSSSRAGLTLIEIMIVVVIMGILLGLLVAPLAEVRDSMRIDGAAQQVAGDIRRLQVEAIKRNKPLTLLRTSATAYTVDSIGSRTLEDGVTFATASSSQVRMASFGPPVGGGASFILNYGTRQKTVAINSAGMLSIQ